MRRRTKLLIGIGSAMLAASGLGCAETPLDATLLEEQEAPQEMQTVGDVDLCLTDTLERERFYYLIGEARMECLSAGEPTDIAMTPSAMGHTVRFEPCEDVPAQHWQLLDGDDTPFDDGTYQVLNQELELNLDLEARQFQDGTELLLYDPHGMDNQVFSFDLRGDDRFRIQTVLSVSSCLQDMITGENAVELQGCSLARRQLWYLSSVDCTPE